VAIFQMYRLYNSRFIKDMVKDKNKIEIEEGMEAGFDHPK